MTSPRPPAPRLQFRFTLGVAYVFAFFMLYSLLIVAPALFELAQTLPPLESREAEQQAAAELAREVIRPKLGLALAAALLTTAAGVWTGVLPGTRRRR